MTTQRDDLRSARFARDAERFDYAFAERLRDRDDGLTTLTDEEHARYMAGDEELTLVSRYLDWEMTSAEMREFEARLEEDPGFFERVAPVIALQALLKDGTIPRPRPPVARFLSAASVVLLLAGASGIAMRARTHQAAVEQREGRAATTHFWPQTSHRGFADRPDTMVIRQGIVRLDPGARWGFGKRLPDYRDYATLDGRAVLDIGAEGLRVETAVAEAQLSEGGYEITSVPGSRAMRLRVRDGRADVRRLGNKAAPWVTVRTGFEARIAADSAVVVVKTKSEGPTKP